MPTFTINGGQTVTIQQTLLGAETGTIDALGALTVNSAANAAVLFNGVTTNTLLTNSGTIGNNLGRTVFFDAATGASLGATIINNNSISSSGDAIAFSHVVTGGLVAITNGGTIDAKGGSDGVDFFAGNGAFTATITNKLAAAISGEGDAIRIGGEIDLDNSGQIAGGTAVGLSAEADGIELAAGATGNIDNLDAIGTAIRGDRYGIAAGNGAAVTIDNGVAAGSVAVIEGANGAGIFGAVDSDLTVNNSGTIRGQFTAGLDLYGRTMGDPNAGGPDGTDDGDGDGINTFGKVTIVNKGSIIGVESKGTDETGRDNVSAGITAGGGTITNEIGATIQGKDFGILIQADGGFNPAPFETHIVNRGTISGGSSVGISIAGSFDDTIFNDGTITNNNSGASGIFFGSGNNTLSIGVNSKIIGEVDGFAGTDTISYADYAGGGGVTVSLAGAATGTDGLFRFENIVGSAGNDALTGEGTDNVINGGAGADDMRGLGGNDFFYVDNAGDKVTEAVGGGNDRVSTSVSFALGGLQEIETLTTTNSTAVRSIDLKGNFLSQTIIGNNGSNWLHDGGAAFGGGADTLVGGGGNDYYTVYRSADVIIEKAGGGDFDRVAAGVNYTLGKGVHVESLRKTSQHATYAVDLTGNEFIQQIIGNDGNNRLDGAGGSDTIETGLGDDTVVISTAPGAANVDTVTDYASFFDTVELKSSLFAALSTGVLSSAAFASNTTGLAAEADDRIIYNTDTGELFYDADGTGGTGGVHFLTMAGAPIVVASDFVVI